MLLTKTAWTSNDKKFPVIIIIFSLTEAPHPPDATHTKVINNSRPKNVFITSFEEYIEKQFFWILFEIP